MTYAMNNEELYHFGIPGMKWGIRKVENTLPRDARKITRETRKNLESFPGRVKDYFSGNKKQKESENLTEEEKKSLEKKKKIKTAALIATGAAAAALGGAYIQRIMYKKKWKAYGRMGAEKRKKNIASGRSAVARALSK